MASFSNDVKKELCKGITDKDKRYACLYGILLYCKGLTDSHISFSTECEEFALLFEMLVKSIFNNEIKVKIETGSRKNGNKAYALSIEDKQSVSRIQQTYNINIERREINLKNIVNNSLNVFLAGVFFICGSVSDPYKEYHLEFTVPNEQLYKDLHDILLSLGIESGKTVRKGLTVLYVKDSENIEGAGKERLFGNLSRKRKKTFLEKSVDKGEEFCYNHKCSAENLVADGKSSN